jgi:hypothetical protein
MNEPVQRYVPMDEERERLRPVLIMIMTQFDAERAADMILGLVDVRRRPTEPIPAPLTANGAAHHPRAAPASRQTPSRGAAAPAQKRTRPPRIPPPLPDAGSGRRTLEPFEWYTIGETGEFLGVGEQTIRNILRDQVGVLRSKKDADERGVQRTVILGRTIIALRHKRQKAAAGEAPPSGAADHGDDESDRSSADELGELPPPDDDVRTENTY